MKVSSQLYCVGLTVVCLMAAAGCGADNETEAQALAKAAGKPGAANPDFEVTPPQQPKTMEEYAKQQEALQKQALQSYPGGSNKK